MNSRGRINLLDDFLTSFYWRTKYISRVKLFIRIDNDDIESLNYFKKLNKQIFKPIFNLIIDDRNYNINSNLNFIALNNYADFYWGLNNDTEIMSNHWDLILDDYIEEYNIKKKIAYLYTDDDYDSFEPCCFPILSYETVHVMNCLLPSEIQANGADSALYAIFSKFPDRIFKCPLLAVDHKCNHNKKLEQDEINKFVCQISYKSGLDNHEFNSYIQKIKNGINNGY